MKKVKLLNVQVREFFAKRILPTLGKAIADRQLRICALSLVITTMSVCPLLGFMGYACMALDGYSLLCAARQHELLTWQSAISILSISLTVLGMFVFPFLSIPIGIASVVLDLVVLVYQVVEFRRKNSYK